MQEINLEAIWDTNTIRSEKQYADLKPSVTELAQQKSQGIVQKIIQQTFGELVFSFVLLIGMSTFLWDVPKVLLGIFVVYSLTTLWISFQFWNNFREKAIKISNQNTKKAIQMYVELLKSYKTHLWNYSVSLIPFTVFIGFLGGYCKGSNNQLATIFESQLLWISILTILIIIGIGYLMIRQYFKLVLDNKIEELETLLIRMEE